MSYCSLGWIRTCCADGSTRHRAWPTQLRAKRRTVWGGSTHVSPSRLDSGLCGGAFSPMSNVFRIVLVLYAVSARPVNSCNVFPIGNWIPLYFTIISTCLCPNYLLGSFLQSVIPEFFPADCELISSLHMLAKPLGFQLSSVTILSATKSMPVFIAWHGISPRTLSIPPFREKPEKESTL